MPISYREILLTSRMMDSVFEQINASPHLQTGKPDNVVMT